MLLCGSQRLVMTRKIGEKRCAVVDCARLESLEKMTKKKEHPNVVTLLFAGEKDKKQWRMYVKDVLLFCNEITSALASLEEFIVC